MSDDKTKDEINHMMEKDFSMRFWSYQFVHNIDNLMRDTMTNILAELEARLEVICGSKAAIGEAAWNAGLADIRGWNAMTIDGEVLALQRRSYHFESYLQQMFQAFVVESMRMIDSSRMHYDILNVPVTIFVRIYFDTCCGAPTVAAYRTYSTQRPSEMKFIYREILEQTLDRCANEFFHTCEVVPSSDPAAPHGEPHEDCQYHHDDSKDDPPPIATAVEHPPEEEFKRVYLSGAVEAMDMESTENASTVVPDVDSRDDRPSHDDDHDDGQAQPQALSPPRARRRDGTEQGVSPPASPTKTRMHHGGEEDGREVIQDEEVDRDSPSPAASPERPRRGASPRHHREDSRRRRRSPHATRSRSLNRQ